jgi:phage baseplate assembly protein gpV
VANKKKAPSKVRDHVGVRFPDEGERADVERAAQKYGVKLSTYIRIAAVRVARSGMPPG